MAALDTYEASGSRTAMPEAKDKDKSARLFAER